jgi:hypothetical protein
MLVDGVNGVISAEELEAFIPLGIGAKVAEVKVDFRHTIDVCTGVLESNSNLLMFVSPRIHG